MLHSKSSLFVRAKTRVERTSRWYSWESYVDERCVVLDIQTRSRRIVGSDRTWKNDFPDFCPTDPLRPSGRDLWPVSRLLPCSRGRVRTVIAIPVAGSSSNENRVGEVGGNRVVVGGFHLHGDRQILRDGSTDTCNHADSLQHGTARRNSPDRGPYRSQIIQDTARWRLLRCLHWSSSDQSSSDSGRAGCCFATLGLLRFPLSFAKCAHGTLFAGGKARFEKEKNKRKRIRKEKQRKRLDDNCTARGDQPW